MVVLEESPCWGEISVGWGCGVASSDLTSHWEDVSSPKVEIAIPQKLAEHTSLLSSHLPHGWRDTHVRRGACPQDRVYRVTTWTPNHYKRGNGLLQGTLWSLRAFCCTAGLSWMSFTLFLAVKGLRFCLYHVQLHYWHWGLVISCWGLLLSFC